MVKGLFPNTDILNIMVLNTESGLLFFGSKLISTPSVHDQAGFI